MTFCVLLEGPILSALGLWFDRLLPLLNIYHALKESLFNRLCKANPDLYWGTGNWCVCVVCDSGGECRGGRRSHHPNHLPGRHEPFGLLESAHGHECAKGRVHHRDDEYGKRACLHRGAGRDRLCGYVVWLDGRPRARVGPCLALCNSHVPHVAETHIQPTQNLKRLVVTQKFKVLKKLSP